MSITPDDPLYNYIDKTKGNNKNNKLYFIIILLFILLILLSAYIVYSNNVDNDSNNNYNNYNHNGLANNTINKSIITNNIINNTNLSNTNNIINSSIYNTNNYNNTTNENTNNTYNISENITNNVNYTNDTTENTSFVENIKPISLEDLFIPKLDYDKTIKISNNGSEGVIKIYNTNNNKITFDIKNYKTNLDFPEYLSVKKEKKTFKYGPYIKYYYYFGDINNTKSYCYYKKVGNYYIILGFVNDTPEVYELWYSWNTYLNTKLQ